MIDWRVLLLLVLAGCSQASEQSEQTPTISVADNAAAGPVAPPPAPTRQSAFTRLDPAKCRLIEENKEEGPYWLRRCPGHAGWRLDWSDSDLRQDLTLIGPGGQETELRLSELVARGAFNSIGETIEWRGRDAAKPDALLLRMNVANGVEPRLPDISRLAVVRLTGTPCLVAIVEPASDQTAKARVIADGATRGCMTD